MTAEHEIGVGLPRVARAAGEWPPGGLAKRLLDVAELIWSELALPSRPRLTITEDAVVTVTVDGRPVPVSARRIEQAALAGGGAARRPGEDDPPHGLLLARLAGPDPAAAANTAACLVEVALRGAAAGLIGADSKAIAERLIAEIGDGAPPLAIVQDAVRCAAEHGVVPGRAGQEGELAGDAAASGPGVLCERLTRAWLRQEPPRPVIEVGAETLRRLTSHGPLRTENSALDHMRILFSDYGVRPPPASLRVTGEPGPLVRFGFGASRSAPHLVLPDTQAVVLALPAALPGSGARPFVDPVSGDVWSVVDLPAEPLWPPEMQLDPAALLMRSLLAEMKVRLPLWAPAFTNDDLPTFDWRGVDAERLHLGDASGALRWLLSAQASVHLLPRLTEGVLTAAADGVTGPGAIAAQLRSFLGRGVLGPLAASSGYAPVEVSGATARKAAESASPAPILAEHPDLLTEIQPLVVTCPDRWRREVECLLRPLNDTVVVAADTELARLPAATT